MKLIESKIFVCEVCDWTTGINKKDNQPPPKPMTNVDLFTMFVCDNCYAHHWKHGLILNLIVIRE